MTIQAKYDEYVQQVRKMADIGNAMSVLHWDNEVNAPSKGAAFRSQQLATLAALAHELATSAQYGVLLADLNAQRDQLDARQARNVELSLKDYNQHTKFPVEFVKNYSQARSEAFQAWVKAREAKDYTLFRDALARIVALNREKAALAGYEAHPYNALLDEYEEGATVAQLDPLFVKIRQELVTFVQRLNQDGKATDRDFLYKHYPKQAQLDITLALLREMGYDMEAGRQDLAHHPFCTTFSPLDVRVTTRVNENDLVSAMGSSIHEGGHALYEQGLSADEYGLPTATAVSLGIHESQSRLWENNVGLSQAYWVRNFDKVAQAFPEQLSGVDVATFYKAINQIQPNLIRVDADELHYHLHVLIRYEIEKGLLDGSLSTDNLNEVWNEKYREYMGVEVPDDKQGVLQDVHWSEGLMGYFPTYSLGSFYAAQFFAKAKQAVPNLEAEIAKGNNQPLLDWLRTNIHQYGRFYSPNELCKHATGEYLNVEYFLGYVKEKYSNIYGLV